MHDHESRIPRILGRKVPEEWRLSFLSDFHTLGLNWLTLQQSGGPDRKVARRIAEGELPTAMMSTLVKMTAALPVEDVEQLRLRELLGIQGSFGDILVEWRGLEATFGDHANKMLWELEIRTRAHLQAVADIALPFVQFTGTQVRRLGPNRARRWFMRSFSVPAVSTG